MSSIGKYHILNKCKVLPCLHQTGKKANKKNKQLRRRITYVAAR